MCLQNYCASGAHFYPYSYNGFHFVRLAASSSLVLLFTSNAQISFNMADDFEQKTFAFLQWLRATPGFRLSSKIKLVDLREQGRGRGIGEMRLQLHLKTSQQTKIFSLRLVLLF